MGESFETKVRAVGTSLGVLIPKDIAKEMNIRKGEKVRIGILKENKKVIDELFGSAKGAKPFERDHRDRF